MAAWVRCRGGVLELRQRHRPFVATVCSRHLQAQRRTASAQSEHMPEQLQLRSDQRMWRAVPPAATSVGTAIGRGFTSATSGTASVTSTSGCATSATFGSTTSAASVAASFRSSFRWGGRGLSFKAVRSGESRAKSTHANGVHNVGRWLRQPPNILLP